jgi:hypothetical protein
MRADLEANLQAPVDAGATDEGRGGRLRAIAGEHDPGVARSGVVHTELCPENLVVDP